MKKKEKVPLSDMLHIRVSRECYADLIKYKIDRSEVVRAALEEAINRAILNDPENIEVIRERKDGGFTQVITIKKSSPKN